MLRVTRVLRQAAPAAGADWTSTIGPFSLPSYSAKWKEMLNNVTNQNDFVASVPKTVGTIDFAKYEAKLQDKEEFAKVKAAHEAAMAQSAGAVNIDPEAELAKYAKAIELFEKWSGVADTHVANLKAELGRAKEIESNIANWSLQDYYDNMPGIEAQLLQEFEDNKYWSTEEEDKIDALDYSALTEKLADGVLTGPAPETLPAQVGDVVLADYLKDSEAVKEELKADLRAVVGKEGLENLEAGFARVEIEWAAKHPAL